MHTLKIDIPALEQQIDYHSKLMLTGSCFAENMAIRLKQHRFDVLDNPHGILFNPYSVAASLQGYITGTEYTEDHLFYQNELWNSYDHHTNFSDVNKDIALNSINQSQKQANEFIHKATHIIITLGSAYYYQLKESDRIVSNNHRTAANLLDKKLMTSDAITELFTTTLNMLLEVNPNVRIIFTVSPVRHHRDGIVENNRSKARIIESVHQLCDTFTQAYYFPAYELVIDILRDHRYYDIDFVHPNYLATDYVWGRLVDACMNEETKTIMKQMSEIDIARKHKPRFPQTEAHKKFRESYVQKIRALMTQYPYIQLDEELAYFTD